MRRTRTSYAVACASLLLTLAACGSEVPDVASDGTTSSATPTEPASEPPSPQESEEPEAEPSVDPEPAVVEGLDLAFDAEALTMTLRVPELVASDRLLVLYRWQTRDVRVAVETTLVGEEPALNAVWADNQTEMSGTVKDVDATWDLEAGTVTITLRERLNGDQATVSALGLGPKDRYPVQAPPSAVTETVQRD